MSKLLKEMSFFQNGANAQTVLEHTVSIANTSSRAQYRHYSAQHPIFSVKFQASEQCETRISPLSNPENLPISRPPPKSSNMFPNINSIQDLQQIAGTHLQRIASTHPDTPSPLPSLLSRTFTSKKDIRSVRILQFNLLARGLSSPPKNGGFVASPVASLDFDNYRKYRLLEEILRFDPDIVTLEEMDQYDDFFQPLMSKFGYDSIFQPKLDAPTLGIWNEKMKEKDKVGQVPYYSDGSGIFWKRNVYQCLESKSINYHSQDQDKTKEWGQVGIMVRLLNTSNGQILVLHTL